MYDPKMSLVVVLGMPAASYRNIDSYVLDENYAWVISNLAVDQGIFQVQPRNPEDTELGLPSPQAA